MILKYCSKTAKTITLINITSGSALTHHYKFSPSRSLKKFDPNTFIPVRARQDTSCCPVAFAKRFGVLTALSANSFSSLLPYTREARCHSTKSVVMASKSDECNNNKSLSGSCICGSLKWKLTNTEVSQVLVCHCSTCRRFSGSSYIPYAAIPRQHLEDALGPSPSSLSIYKSTPVASRAFCKICGSSMYMDYGEENTLWVPLGIIDHFDPSRWLSERDSQIYLESKAEYTDAITNLPHLSLFGTYRPDPCQTGRPFESLATWEEVDDIANYVDETEKNEEIS